MMGGRAQNLMRKFNLARGPRQSRVAFEIRSRIGICPELKSIRVGRRGGRLSALPGFIRYGPHKIPDEAESVDRDFDAVRVFKIRGRRCVGVNQEVNKIRVLAERTAQGAQAFDREGGLVAL